MATRAMELGWRGEEADETARLRRIGDFIAGMTDRYAISRHRELVGPVDLPEGFSVNLFASEETVPELKKPVQIAFDPKGATPRQYGIKGMPSSVLIGPDGKVLLEHSGFRDADRAELEAKIQSALGAVK